MAGVAATGDAGVDLRGRWVPGWRTASPATLRVALAGISPVTLARVPRWQVSQVVLDGMCDKLPIGVVRGRPMMLVMPAKVVVEPDGRWQATQLFVMPVWLMRELLNLAPLGTGSTGTLEPVPTWHSSQAALVGMWLLGRPTMKKLAAGMAKLAAAVPWHCAQLAVVLGALAWMLASVGIVA